MTEFVHHPKNQNRLTGKKLDAKSPHLQKHTGKTLVAKTAPSATQFPNAMKQRLDAIRRQTTEAQEMAKVIQACLEEDLQDHMFEVQGRTDGNYDIKIWSKSEWYGNPMFDLGIKGNVVTLVRNHSGDGVYDMGFVLEDPRFFTKLTKQIKKWTKFDDK